MKKLVTILVAGVVLVVAIAAVSMGSTVANAEGKCKKVNGHITSKVVSVLPDGTECPSLCTVGKFIGVIQGDFIFVATGFVDNPQQPTVPFTTGVIDLTTKDGTLKLLDASAFSPGMANDFPTDFFASVQTVDKFNSTGDFSDATGRIRAEGVFQNGCIDCDYRGEICTP